jgi:fused signal recognition particle receptor
MELRGVWIRWAAWPRSARVSWRQTRLRAERARVSSARGESAARNRAAFGSPGQKWRGLEPIDPNPFVDGSRNHNYNESAVLGNLKEKLARTRQAFRERLGNLFLSGQPRDKILEELTEALLLADTGIAATDRIIQAVKEKTRKDDAYPAILQALSDELAGMLGRYPSGLAVDQAPAVIMVVGVNGGGKTTSLAKLARHFQTHGKKVLMVAADTFRAAAQEQLAIWGKQLGIPVIHGQYGADPAAVVYDALQSFKARGYDLLLVDTAGRVHTNANLMSELEKVKRVIGREIAGAPQEILLVLDSSIGQNALVQAREFLKFAGITGLFLTKLDGTAKGGSVISIVEELKLPVKFIGVGEDAQDILPFSPREFTDALIS